MTGYCDNDYDCESVIISFTPLPVFTIIAVKSDDGNVSKIFQTSVLMCSGDVSHFTKFWALCHPFPRCKRINQIRLKAHTGYHFGSLHGRPAILLSDVHQKTDFPMC